ncbi:hypothetical protein BESB_046530 [Besnoitia besnoiti]|uniref:Uncharacterized protein n=1 Tax=Besnoitia besnoiti TaxID=94643 RepID=A0A2A9MJN1_BESBE|nr:hypothetical protein BESB_046530 [Besnoitia besnoiti]PFH36461.1 hypothetical protein BESB_046530 [Besnoitia besnoiti]
MNHLQPRTTGTASTELLWQPSSSRSAIERTQSKPHAIVPPLNISGLQSSPGTSGVSCRPHTAATPKRGTSRDSPVYRRVVARIAASAQAEQAEDHFSACSPVGPISAGCGIKQAPEASRRLSQCPRTFVSACSAKLQPEAVSRCPIRALPSDPTFTSGTGIDGVPLCSSSGHKEDSYAVALASSPQQAGGPSLHAGGQCADSPVTKLPPRSRRARRLNAFSTPMGSSPTTPLVSVQSTPCSALVGKRLESSRRAAVPVSARSQTPSVPSWHAPDSTSPSCFLPRASARSSEFSDVTPCKGHNPRALYVRKIRRSSTHICDSAALPYARDTRTSILRHRRGGDERSLSSACLSPGEAKPRFPGPFGHGGNASRRDSPAGKSGKLVDPATYTRLPPAVWVYKYQPPIESPHDSSSPCAAAKPREQTSQDCGAVSERGEGSYDAAEDPVGSASARGARGEAGHIGKQIAFPLENPHGHQQAEFLCSSIPLLLQTYEVPTLFRLKNGIADDSKPFAWPPALLGPDGAGVAASAKSLGPACASGLQSTTTDDTTRRDEQHASGRCQSDQSVPLQRNREAHSKLSSPRHAPVFARRKTDGVFGREGSSCETGRNPGTQAGGEASGETTSRLGYSSVEHPPFCGLLATGLQAVHQCQLYQDWWRGLMQTMDVALSELCRQLKLFAPFHARCVEKLRQLLVAYAESHDATLVKNLADIQVSLLKLYENVTVLRQKKRDLARRMETLEERSQQADQLKRMLEIHTLLFGLQELEVLAVRQSEEESTAADAQWQHLLEHLEAIRLNREGTARQQTWVTRATGEWKGRELADQSQEPIRAVFPVSASLLPHQTFFRGALALGHVKLLRVDIPPGRWSMGLAVTCTAPLDVSLLMLSARRRLLAEQREGDGGQGQQSGQGAHVQEGSDFLICFERAAGSGLRRDEAPQSNAAPGESPGSPALPFLTLDPSLALVSASAPERNSFAAFRVHPEEPQILHVRTPPNGTTHGAWLLVRLQPANGFTRARSDRALASCSSALNAPRLSALEGEECFPKAASAASRQDHAGLCVPLCGTRGSSLPTQCASGASTHDSTQTPGGERAVPRLLLDGPKADSPTGFDESLKFSIGLHSVFLHPSAARKEPSGQGEVRQQRVSSGGKRHDGSTNTLVVDSSGGEVDAAERDAERRVDVANLHASAYAGWASPQGLSGVVPRFAVRRNACVQTTKSSLLRGRLRALHEGSRPPPIPQFCVCGYADAPSADLSPSSGAMERSRDHASLPRKDFAPASSSSPNSSLPSSSLPSFSSPPRASASELDRSSSAEPAPPCRGRSIDAPPFYAPSFPLLKLLLDETPVHLGDFSALLHPPSCEHGGQGAAATPYGVLSGSRFVRWPPQLLVETAWILLLQRARERRWARERREAREHRRKVLWASSAHATGCTTRQDLQADRRAYARDPSQRRRRAARLNPKPSPREIDARVACGARDNAARESPVPGSPMRVAKWRPSPGSGSGGTPRAGNRGSPSRGEDSGSERGGRTRAEEGDVGREEAASSPRICHSCSVGEGLDGVSRQTGAENGRVRSLSKGEDTAGSNVGSGGPPVSPAFCRALSADLESSLAKESQEESLASFTFTFFLRRFGVAFLAQRAMHSFLLSLLYYAPLLTAVSPLQQRDAACGRNTYPCHASVFEFERLSHSTSKARAQPPGPPGVSGSSGFPSYLYDFPFVSSFEQRQQVRIGSRIRGMLPLFSARLFGRLTGLLASSSDTAPFRRSLEEFLCLTLEALIDQIGADQATARARVKAAEERETARRALLLSATASLFPSRINGSRTERLAASHPQAGETGEIKPRRLQAPEPSVDKEEGLCLAVSHAAAAKIVNRVFHIEGTAEYRLAALEAIDTHRQAAVSALRVSRQPRLRARWARGLMVITGRERIANVPEWIERETGALLRGTPMGSEDESSSKDARQTATQREIRAGGRPGACDGSAIEGSDGDGDTHVRGSNEKEVDPHKTTRRKQRGVTQRRKRREEGWDLLVPADLLIQTLIQQWEVMYVHLQQAMEMVLYSESLSLKRPLHPLLSFNEFSDFLLRLDSRNADTAEQRLALYRHALFAAASRLHPLGSSLDSSSLAALLLHQSQILAFPLPFPASPFVSLGPAPGPETASEDASGDETGSSRSQMSRGRPVSAGNEGTVSESRPNPSLSQSREAPYASWALSDSPPPSVSSPSYECRLAAFVVDGLVLFLCTEARDLLQAVERDFRRGRGLSISQRKGEERKTQESPEATLAALAAEHKRKISSKQSPCVLGSQADTEGDEEESASEKKKEGKNWGLTDGQGETEIYAEAASAQRRKSLFSAAVVSPNRITGAEGRGLHGVFHLIKSWCASAEGYRPLYAQDARLLQQRWKLEAADLTAGPSASAILKDFAARAPIKNFNYLNRREVLAAAKDLDVSATEQNASAAILLAKTYLLLRDLFGVFGEAPLPEAFCYTVAHESALGAGCATAALASPCWRQQGATPAWTAATALFTPRRGRLSLRTRDQREEEFLVDPLDDETLQSVVRSVWAAVERASALAVEHMERTRAKMHDAAFARLRNRAATKEALGELARLYREQVDRLLILSVGSDAFSEALEQPDVRKRLLLVHQRAHELEGEQFELQAGLHAAAEAAQKKREDEERRTEDDANQHRE